MSLHLGQKIRNKTLDSQNPNRVKTWLMMFNKKKIWKWHFQLVDREGKSEVMIEISKDKTKNTHELNGTKCNLFWTVWNVSGLALEFFRKCFESYLTGLYSRKLQKLTIFTLHKTSEIQSKSIRHNMIHMKHLFFF